MRLRSHRSILPLFVACLLAACAERASPPAAVTDSGPRADAGATIDSAATMDAVASMDAVATADARGTDAPSPPPADAHPVDATSVLDAGSGDRTPVTDRCARSTHERCGNDGDCFTGGCGGELCAASAGGITTCDCTAPAGASCGCVANECIWYSE